LRANAPEFSELAAFQANPFTVGRAAQWRRCARVIPGTVRHRQLLHDVRREAAAGRLLLPDDDRPAAAPVAVLSYRAWVRYGLDPSVIGTSAVINGMTMTIVGVTDPAFYGDTMRPDPAASGSQSPGTGRARRRLAEEPRGPTLALTPSDAFAAAPILRQLARSITIVLQQWLGGQSVFTNEDRRAFPRQQIALAPAGGGVPLMRRQFSSSLTILFLTSAVLLLIACANLANLLSPEPIAARPRFAPRSAPRRAG
jgi:hypothetical protein